MTEWADETLHTFYRQSLAVEKMLYDSETDHQRIRVFENAYWGRVMTLDGVVQTTEGDNFIYHEMLTHVPILAHGAAKRVLIIGGGDGGMAREALRHRSVEHVTMVEIDAGVVEFCKEYMPELSQGAFDVFMCGDAEPQKSIGVLSQAFETTDIRVKELRRGVGIVEASL